MQSEQLDTGVRVHSEFSFFGRFAGSSSKEPPREQDEFLQAWNDRRVSPRARLMQRGSLHKWNFT